MALHALYTRLTLATCLTIFLFQPPIVIKLSGYGVQMGASHQVDTWLSPTIHPCPQFTHHAPCAIGVIMALQALIRIQDRLCRSSERCRYHATQRENDTVTTCRGCRCGSTFCLSVSCDEVRPHSVFPCSLSELSIGV